MFRQLRNSGPSWRISCAVVAASILLLGAGYDRSSRADEPEKLAVLILGASDADGELADNVTEVIIAQLAQRSGVELAGTVEFRKRLGVESNRRAQTCLDDPACLGRVAVSLGVRRIVSGTVGARGKQFLFSLTLNDVQSNQTQNRVFRLVDGRVEDLIRSVQDAADELFSKNVEPGRLQLRCDLERARVSIDKAYVGTTPLISGNLVPGQHEVRVEKHGHFPWTSSVEVLPGSKLEINLTGENLPQRYAWPAYAAYGTAVGAALGLAAGIVFGAAAQLSPTGASRGEAQAQFEDRRRIGAIADAAFISAGVLAVTSAFFFWHYRDHIVGRAVSDE